MLERTLYKPLERRNNATGLDAFFSTAQFIYCSIILLLEHSFLPSTTDTKDPLTNNQRLLGGEVVLGNLEVQWCRTLPDASGDIVVGTVARAEPTAKVTSLADWHTTQVGADTCRIALAQRFHSSP